MKNVSISGNDSKNTVSNSNKDPVWMTAIKTEAQIGRQLVLESLAEHPYIKKMLIDRQVCS